MLYEVEVRSLLKPQGYRKLYNYLKKQGKLLEDIKEETINFRSRQGDLLLRRSEIGTKLTYKVGRVTDDIRSEMEVMADKDDFEEFEQIMLALKFKVNSRWFKKRKKFRWQGYTICLDNVKGLGLMMEMEKLVDSRMRVKARKDLQQKLKGLFDKFDLPVTTKPAMDKVLLNYNKNWQKLIKRNYTKI